MRPTWRTRDLPHFCPGTNLWPRDLPDLPHFFTKQNYNVRTKYWLQCLVHLHFDLTRFFFLFTTNKAQFMAESSESGSDDSENEGSVATQIPLMHLSYGLQQYKCRPYFHSWDYMHAFAAINLSLGDTSNYQKVELCPSTDIWQVHYSQSRKRHFYYNVLTKKVGSDAGYPTDFHFVRESNMFMYQ